VDGTVDFATLGGGGDETITVGVDNSGPRIPHVGRLNLRDRKRYIRAVSAKGGSSQTGGFVAFAVLLSNADPPIEQVIPYEFSV
jgi:hypothetical protein